MPAQDRDARTLILAFLREVEEAGADPIAELRDGTRRWFGARAASALPAPRREPAQADSDTDRTRTPVSHCGTRPCGRNGPSV